MADEATAPSLNSEHSTDEECDKDLAYLLVDSVNPGNSVISVSFVTASEIYGNDFEQLKASMASVCPIR